MFKSIFTNDKKEKERKEAFDKSKQLNELKNHFSTDRMRRPYGDDTLFEIYLRVQGQTSTLRVFVPDDFPRAKPILTVGGPLVHPWLTQLTVGGGKVVSGCDQLNAWNASSALFEIVNIIKYNLESGTNEIPIPQQQTSSASSSTYPAIQYQQQQQQRQVVYPALQQLPPQFMQQQQQQQQQQQLRQSQVPSNAIISQSNGNLLRPSPTIQQEQNQLQQMLQQEQQQQQRLQMDIPTVFNMVNATNSSNANTQNIKTPTSDRQTCHIAIPNIPSEFPELNTLSEAQLHRLLNDTPAMHAHVRGIPDVNAMGHLLEQLHDSNQESCTINLAFEDELMREHRSFKELQLQLKTKLTSYKELISVTESKYKTNSDGITTQLKKRLEEIDTTANSLDSTYDHGDIDVSSFLTEYIKVKTKYHVLQLKMLRIGLMK